MFQGATQRVLILSELPNLYGSGLYWSFVEFERSFANRTGASGLEAPRCKPFPSAAGCIFYILENLLAKECRLEVLRDLVME